MKKLKALAVMGLAGVLTVSMAATAFAAEGFDAFAYLGRYSDLRAALGNDAALAEVHWNTFGKYEGRIGSADGAQVAVASTSATSDFDAQIYYDNYPDLQTAIGMNPEALRQHWEVFGKAEGRIANRRLGQGQDSKSANWLDAYARFNSGGSNGGSSRNSHDSRNSDSSDNDDKKKKDDPVDPIDPVKPDQKGFGLYTTGPNNSFQRIGGYAMITLPEDSDTFDRTKVSISKQTGNIGVDYDFAKEGKIFIQWTGGQLEKEDTYPIEVYYDYETTPRAKYTLKVTDNILKQELKDVDIKGVRSGSTLPRGTVASLDTKPIGTGVDKAYIATDGVTVVAVDVPAGLSDADWPKASQIGTSRKVRLTIPATCPNDSRWAVRVTYSIRIDGKVVSASNEIDFAVTSKAMRIDKLELVRNTPDEGADWTYGMTDVAAIAEVCAKYTLTATMQDGTKREGIKLYEATSPVPSGESLPISTGDLKAILNSSKNINKTGSQTVTFDFVGPTTPTNIVLKDTLSVDLTVDIKKDTIVALSLNGVVPTSRDTDEASARGALADTKVTLYLKSSGTDNAKINPDAYELVGDFDKAAGKPNTFALKKSITSALEALKGVDTTMLAEKKGLKNDLPSTLVVYNAP